MKAIIFYVCAILVFVQTGCRKFVELDPPKTLVVSTNAFKSDVTANSTIAGIYIQMTDQGILPFRLAAFTALSSDELNTRSDSYRTIFQNALQALNAPTNDIWINLYKYIYQANAVYEGCEQSSEISTTVKKQLMAEACFIRAFCYFHLTNLYGDVPLILTTNYQQNAVTAKSVKALIYEQVIKDLLYAQKNLNKDYISSNSTSTTAQRVRPNSAAATALLARVYLYVKDYAKAATQATSVIEQSTIYSIETPEKAFLIESKEAIWQLAAPTPNDLNTTEGRNFILTSAPRNSTSRSTFMQSSLLNTFHKDDLRYTKWIGKVTSAGTSYSFPFKYKVSISTSFTEHSIVLRLAEQFLIRAESNAQMNNIPQSIEDLDVIRRRAGLPLIKDTNLDIAQDSLLIAIIKERQREFFCEWGHRWFDLKRTGQIDSVMKAIASEKNSVWSSYKQLWPIPQSDIGNNVNLIQNLGYN